MQRARHVVIYSILVVLVVAMRAVVAPAADDGKLRIIVFGAHPDHRYTGVLMQDAAFMVTVSFFCPDAPQMAKNPVFLYLSDNFQKPNPFEPDVIVAIDDVFDQKFEAIWKLESQIESLWATGNFEKVIPVPTDPAERAKRKEQVRQRIAGRSQGVAEKYRAKLIERYGPEKGAKIEHAEAFELCEYGRRASAEELKKLFPN